jgi:signal transduction histidine kinase
MDTLLRTVGGLLVVLNEDRQIVALNHAFLDALGVADPGTVLGLRLGESLRCVHAAQPPNGCGTTPHCVTCGAAIAMMAAIREDRTLEAECVLTSRDGGDEATRTLRVRAAPLADGGRRWILVFARDTTEEQFRTSLERVFFHDVSNLLTAALGTGELLAHELPGDELVAQQLHTLEILAKEVSVQRTLADGLDGGPPADSTGVALEEIRRELELVVSGHPAARSRKVEAFWPREPVLLRTDPLLVSRVLSNMVLNALEATPEGDGIRLTTAIEPGHVRWEVWNPGAIPGPVQLRIFQRFFSTKARAGRGLGTYSMKLFGEQYLGGEVSFASGPVEGTTFVFRLPRPDAPSRAGSDR